MAQQNQSQKSPATKKQSAKQKAMMAEVEESQSQEMMPDERHQMIAEAAYHIAEQRGFQGDNALDDWLQAEAEVNARFTSIH